jgi:iron complex transport system permease protein
MPYNIPDKNIGIETFSERRKIIIIGILFTILIISGLVVITLGAYNISIFGVYGVILTHLNPAGDINTIEKLHNTIVWDIRLPRILLAVSVGIALASAGAVFQGCFRNPLVEPYILGVSAGAAFGASLGIVFPQIFLSIQISAFIFGSIAVFAAYTLARVQGQTPIVTLILAGMIIGSIFMAMVSILKYISDDIALNYRFFVLWYMSWILNILSMGDEEARALGVNPERSKLIVVAMATLIAAISVSAVGIIAWVGLMMPHAARMILGPDHRFMLPAAAIMGGIYLLLCDTIARTLTTAEIPVGIIASILGAPYLIYLIRNKSKIIVGG